MQFKLEREGDSVLFEDLERYLRRHPRLTRFLFNPGGFIFAVGILMTTGVLIGWVVIFLLSPEVAAKLAQLVAAEQIGGREVAVPFGMLTLGLPILVVCFVTIVQDLLTSSYLYPAFYYFRERRKGRGGFWGYFFRKMERDAEANKDFIQKYGPVAIFFFMLIPFAVNGPLIGAIVGKLAGIRTRYILPTLVLATIVGIGLNATIWYFFGPYAERFAEGPWKDWILPGVVALLLLVLLKSIIGFVRDVRNYQRVERRRRDIARRLDAGRVEQVLMAETAAEKPDASRADRTP